MKQLLSFGFFLLLGQVLLAQQHAEQNHSKYVPPSDPQVQQKLQQWQTVKFGLLMHWGTYSQWGIVESWSLCPEDEGWCERRGPYANDWYGYKKPTKTCNLPSIPPISTPTNGPLLPKRRA